MLHGAVFSKRAPLAAEETKVMVAPIFIETGN